MQLKDLWTKVRDNWSSLLIITAILTAGTNFGKSMTELNYQLTDLSTTVNKLRQTVETIDELEERILVIEEELLEYQNLSYFFFLGVAEEIIVERNTFEELNLHIVEKQLLRKSCDDQRIREKLIADLGAKTVVTYCNYIS